MPMARGLLGLALTQAVTVNCLHVDFEPAEGSEKSVNSCNTALFTFKPPFDTSCPTPLWVDAMVEADPSPGMVFVDAGCNKGDDLVEWLERWDTTGRGWSKQLWMDTVVSAIGNPRNHCPLETPTRKSPQQPGKGPVGVCIEAMRSNIELIENISHKLDYKFGGSAKEGERGAFHVVHGALLDKSSPGQTIDFPDDEAGTENKGLAISKHKSPVPVMTVDQVVKDLGLGKVDILTVDTEGADPAVLEGAVETLNSVRYLEFEVHRDLGDTYWWGTTLKSVIAKIDKKGFKCFWAGNSGQLIGIERCWQEEFEEGTWANVACVKKGDKWDAVLERFAVA